ncbi:hypothetical protein BpHYR1_044179 [Brachionus plicatilis]|uniref:Uncharacterized protein n=1 Tax=Brachionus plicatilis TaxID=10195 RepID=A0A3M7QHH5_BRAPC|nr:hypothetical protein BpHYR1_044179 [Brachionus plicatilis]
MPSDINKEHQQNFHRLNDLDIQLTPILAINNHVLPNRRQFAGPKLGCENKRVVHKIKIKYKDM